MFTSSATRPLSKAALCLVIMIQNNIKSLYWPVWLRSPQNLPLVWRAESAVPRRSKMIPGHSGLCRSTLTSFKHLPPLLIWLRLAATRARPLTIKPIY